MWGRFFFCVEERIFYERVRSFRCVGKQPVQLSRLSTVDAAWPTNKAPARPSMLSTGASKFGELALFVGGYRRASEKLRSTCTVVRSYTEGTQVTRRLRQTLANAARPTGLPTRRTGPASVTIMGGRFSLPSRTSEADEVITSGSVHAEMIDELSVLTACVGPCRT